MEFSFHFRQTSYDADMAKSERDRDRKVGRPRKFNDPESPQGRSGTPMSLRIAPEISAKLDAYLAFYFTKTNYQLTKTAVIEKALLDLFAKELPDEPTKPAQ